MTNTYGIIEGMKKLLALLLLTPLVVSEEESGIKEIPMFCEYQKNIYHPIPNSSLPAMEDASLVVVDYGNKNKMIVKMYGGSFYAIINTNKLDWTSADSNFDNWEYKHRLDRYTGQLTIDAYVPISETSDISLRNHDFDKDGIINQATYYFQCKKSEAIF